MSMTFKVIINSDLNHLPLFRKIVRDICSNFIQNEEDLHDINISIHEAICNIICHAYLNNPSHQIQVVIKVLSDELEFQIIDLGLKNNQEKKVDALNFDPTNIDSLAESSRGVRIIHQLMDRVKYKVLKKKNVLILNKSIK